MASKVTWLRAFVEGVVIVSSILLAFGIEAWRDGRQDQVLEKVHLEALRDDLGESLQRLNVSTDRFDRTRSSLIALLGQDLANQPKDSVASWIDAGLFALNGYELGFLIPLPDEPDWSPLRRSQTRNTMVLKLTLAGVSATRRAALRQEFEELKTIVDARLADLS